MNQFLLASEMNETMPRVFHHEPSFDDNMNYPFNMRWAPKRILLG
nr:hypothetical protein Q903MT_gene3392 [Picea sitchensis]